MLTYYITDRSQFAGGEAERRNQLLRTMGQAAAAGLDYIQLREKDLTTHELESLAREALRAIRSEGTSKLLINHRTDVALAVGADGVHLTGNDIAASDARALAAWARAHSRVDLKAYVGFLIAVSCHSVDEVRLAYSHGADFAVLAPIFEKAGVRTGFGLEELRRATLKQQVSDMQVEAGEVRGEFPVFALGGVDRQRAPLCRAAGAAGVAGIRLFQECEDLGGLVRWLKQL